MLNWTRFESLSGSNTNNFEKLSRGVIRRQFGKLSPLYELKNQPGVEFYITLNKEHSRLGSKGETIGWQNKWFIFNSKGELTSAEKKQIIKSLDNTVKHVSHINHWILWTHKTLSKKDQTWYYNLKEKYNFKLHLWNQDDLDELLSGPALDLRNSYFGELALTTEMLSSQHEISIAPVKNRWLSEVHQKMNVEYEVRKILGEGTAWGNDNCTINKFMEAIDYIENYIQSSEYDKWHDQLLEFVDLSKDKIRHCDLFKEYIEIDKVNSIIERINSESYEYIHKILRQLRRNNLPLALFLTNALIYIKDVNRLFQSANNLLSQQFIAILADAGGGKTQLAAEITAPSIDRPAGILILGRVLKNGMDLNDIAQKFNFYQKKVDSFEALISAVNSVGERADRRLPIVIDGLNEAQDPREWRELFESTIPILKKYPYVIIVCTLRTSEVSNYNHMYGYGRLYNRDSFSEQALPESTFKITSEGFDEELTLDAINAYFNFYKIKANIFTAPLSFFSHPLNLKIFCDVTNRKAENYVEVSYFPSSIYSLFDEQINYIANSISRMVNLTRKYRTKDVKESIYYLGECLWEEGLREIHENKFRAKLRYSNDDWDSDIVNLLCQEGIIFRNEGAENYTYEITTVYDRLGGFIIADYLLEKNIKNRLNNWLNENDFIKKIFGEISEQHDLYQDILYALIVLIPKKHHGQHLWNTLPNNYSKKVLALSHLIDKENLCTETLNKYKSLIIDEGLTINIIEHLMTVRYSINHPLNIDFFHDILFQLPVYERDLTWTEYIRKEGKDITDNLKKLIFNLKNNLEVDNEIYRFRIIYLSWHLTSTDIDLRDYATEALYFIGLKKPGIFFQITLDFLNVNDPYISERLLASSYAIASKLLLDDKDVENVITFANSLYQAMFLDSSTKSTTHIIKREYASCILQLLKKLHPKKSNNLNEINFMHPYPNMPRKPWGEKIIDTETHFPRTESPFRMDFENYTIGRLVKERGNYDYSNENYQSTRSKILWRVYDLGWSSERFKEVETSITSEINYFTRMRRSTVERYGKKYSWIAYYELAGQYSDENKLEFWGEERFATDIDPFFPEEKPTLELDKKDYIGDENIDTHTWINDTNSQDLSKTFYFTTKENNWVLLDGYITEESKKLDRNYFSFIKTAFISKQEHIVLEKYIKNKKKIKWPEPYGNEDFYSGELYWKETLLNCGKSTLGIETGYETKKYEVLDLIDDDSHNDIFQEYEVPIVETVNVQLPTIKYYWEYSENTKESITQIVLSPWVVEELNLKYEPSSFEYLDQNNKKAVLYRNFKGEEYSNTHKLLYLRSDLLELLKAKLKFIIRINGEKRFARYENLQSPNSYIQFESIFLSEKELNSP